MRLLNFAFAASITGLLAAPAVAQQLPFQVLNPSDYQGFVANWEGDGPFCAAIASPEEWDRVIRPAAVMGANRPFGPPASLYRERTILLIARTVSGGSSASNPLQVQGVNLASGRVRISTRFTPPAGASYQSKIWTAVAVRRPLGNRVDFVENGRIVCSVRLTAAQRSAARPARRRR